MINIFRQKGELTDSRLYDNSSFYRAFERDLLKCKYEAIIECPFITADRVDSLLPTFKKMRSRGIRLVINTKPIYEHPEPHASQASYIIDMQGLYTATKILINKDTLPLELTLDIYTHRFNGSMAVVTDHPRLLMAAVKGQWANLIRKLQTQTMVYKKDELAYLQNFSFTTSRTEDGWRGNVFFSTPLEFKKMPPDCRRLYLTCKVGREDIHMITSWMPYSSMIFIYN